MSNSKILGRVTSCEGCPNNTYYSGGVHRCTLVDEAIIDKTIIAPFCPLPDYPSRVIADMQTTILGLRKPNSYGFGLALMTHVATKLRREIHANGLSICIHFKDGTQDREIHLRLGYIVDVQVSPFELSFTYEERTFKLAADADPPLLREATDAKGTSWREFKLW